MIGSRFGGVPVPVISGRDPVAVALVLQLAVELGDEQAAVGEDQDADRARGLDEAGGGDRLAGRGRVAEAVAADRARVVLRRELLGRARARRGSALRGRRSRRSRRSPRTPPRPRTRLRLVGDGLGLALRGGDQLGQHPGERVHLVAAQLGAGLQVRRLLAQHALEPEHQRVADLPVGRRLLRACLDLGEGVVERAAAGGAGREHLARILVRVQERLAGPRGGALGRSDERARRLRHGQRLIDGFLHRGSGGALRDVLEKAPENPGGRHLAKHSGSGGPAASLGRVNRAYLR